MGRRNIHIFFVFALFFCPLLFLVPAASATTLFYYSKAARLLHLPAGQLTTEEVLLAKTLDQKNSLITEIACMRSPGQSSYLSPIYMKVTGNSLQIADTPDVDHPKKVSGTGTVSGPDWNWTFLKFSMLYLPFSAPVEDVNFVTPTQLIARKMIFQSDGTPIQLYDLEMDLIPPNEYQSHYSEMGCPPQAFE